MQIPKHKLALDYLMLLRIASKYAESEKPVTTTDEINLKPAHMRSENV